jgi:hypothetical protein
MPAATIVWSRADRVARGIVGRPRRTPVKVVAPRRSSRTV